MNEDRVSFSRPAGLCGVELVSVCYRNRAFPMHMHAEYVVGVVTAGAEELEARGARHVVAAGDVLQLHPGEVHANRVIGDGALSYRVFYVAADTVAHWADGGLPAFARPVVHAHRHAGLLADCHAVLSRSDAGPLAQETALLSVVRAMAFDAAPARGALGAGQAIGRVRDYIDAHFADGFGLSTLSEVGGLSVYHLARSFKAAVGLSPLAYRNLRRIHEARRRLLAGEDIAGIACDLGFADQSHLTRQFQKLIGVSPAAYRQQ